MPQVPSRRKTTLLRMADQFPAERRVFEQDFGASISEANLTDATARSRALGAAKNAALVKNLGAAQTVDYAMGPWPSAIAGKVDGVFDFAPSGPHNAGYWAEACEVLKPGGVFVTISGEDPHGAFSIPSFLLAQCVMAWRNWFSGFRYTFVLKSPSTYKLAEIAALVEAGKIRPVVDEVFPWGKAHAAFARLESGRAVGKVVVLPPKATDE